MREAVRFQIVSLRRQKKLCNGVEKSKFEQLISSQKWESERRDVSPVRTFGDRVFAKTCKSQKAPAQRQCDECTTLLRRLRPADSRARIRPSNNERRLIYSNISKLSKTDMDKKKAIIEQRRKNKIQKLEAKAKAVPRLKRRLERFEPKHRECRKAVENLVQHLNQEMDKFKGPTCRWTNEAGIECGFKSAARSSLLRHTVITHLRPQEIHQEDNLIEPWKRRFYCHWAYCKKKAPFNTRKLLYRHMTDHSGTWKSHQRLTILLDQLKNLGRSPSGRRWSKTSKAAALACYRTRRAWDRFQEFSPLPIPS